MPEREKIERVIVVVRELNRLRTMQDEIAAKINTIEAELAELITTTSASVPPPPTTGNGSTVASRVLTYLREHPGAEYSDMARAIYGEDTRAARNRLRAQLHALKQQRRVRPLPGAERGRWEVTAHP